jgi:endoglucanase
VGGLALGWRGAAIADTHRRSPERARRRRETTRLVQRIADEFITDDDLARIAALGFNSVRVPFNHRLLERPEGWAVLDRLVDGCEAHGLVAILDLHAAPGGQSPFFMADPESTSLFRSVDARDRTVALWKSIAERCRDRPGVGGYDLLNEPMPPTSDALLQLFRRIAAGIREVDPHHLVIVEGASFAGELETFTGPVTRNECFSVHQYQLVGDGRQAQLDHFREVTSDRRIPLWIGEFGVKPAAHVAETVRLYDAAANGVAGYAFWTWKQVGTSEQGLVEMTAPLTQWHTLLDWVGHGPVSFQTRPSAADVSVAFDEFLSAARLTNATVHEDMAHALFGEAP